MKFGIRGKFVGILILAIALPIGVAIVAINILGYRYYRDAEGKRFLNQAVQMADFLDLSITGNLEQLLRSVIITGLYERLEEMDSRFPGPGDASFRQRILDLEAKWPELDPGSEEMQVFLDNDIATDLRRIQAVNPLFAEIFVTDRHGQLVASTNKTTDFWQANEKWWQRAIRSTSEEGHVEGINFDSSTGVYSFDIAIPIFDLAGPEGSLVGVIKGVLRASPIFFDLVHRIPLSDVSWKWVLDDGQILFGQSRQIDRIAAEAVERIRLAPSGWMISALLGEEDTLVGYSTLPWKSVSLEPEPQPPTPEQLWEQLQYFEETELGREVLTQEATPLHIVVYQPANEVFAPVQTQLRNVTLFGLLLVLVGSGTGFYLTHTGIIRPIRTLQAAARDISSSAKLEEIEQESLAIDGSLLGLSTMKVLDKVGKIRGNDELGELTRDFEAMARRVLRYHETLEGDLAAKTAELHRDLMMAREFQQALMPRHYPAIPSVGQPAPLKLNFHHVYLPASTVGGDFFNVIKLSDDRAGVFIADVMGHGASSALVTAIVGTLLQDLVYEIQDPAHLMTRMNRHFHFIMSQCDQLVFVSAFYMVVDTRKCTATYASAGHPSPFVAHRGSGTITPLFSQMYDHPALGLLRDSAYGNHSCDVNKETLFVLFTDGIVEALNLLEEEFGPDRLSRVIAENMDQSVSVLNDAVVKALTHFTGTPSFLDDICLLTVEIAENQMDRQDEASIAAGHSAS